MVRVIRNHISFEVLLEECRRMGIKVLPPDVNESKTDFAVVGNNIRFGLLAVKNVGEATADAITQAASNLRLETLADLTSSVDPRHLNRRTLESLIAAGACDSLEGSRARQTRVVEEMLEYGHKVIAQADTQDLFAGAGIEIERVTPKLPQVAEWSSSEELAHEKEALGFWISGHPLDRYRDELATFATSTAAGLEQLVDGREVTLGGVLAKVNRRPDKRGNMMAFATLEDFSGRTELIIFSDCFEKCQLDLEVDRMVLVSGRVSTREGENPKIRCYEILPLEKLAERFNCQLVIKLHSDWTEKTVERALATLQEYKGHMPVLLAARENGSEVYIRSGRYAVSMDFELLNRLKELLGDSAAYLRPVGPKDD